MLHFLTNSQTRAASMAIDAIALLRAVIDTIVIHRQLQAHSLATICTTLSTANITGHWQLDSALIARLTRASDRAGRIVPGSTCLTRSLALQRRLKRYAITSELCIGADPVKGPFAAHAWVEINGLPVNSARFVEQGFRFRFVPESVLKTAVPQAGRRAL